MSNTYTWEVSRMDCYPQAEGETDVVFTVHWRCNGTDGTYSGTVYGTSGVHYQGGTPFTPYNELTLEQVLAWVWDSGVDKDATEAAVAQQIENQVNPPVVHPPLPWAPAPTVE